MSVENEQQAQSLVASNKQCALSLRNLAEKWQDHERRIMHGVSLSTLDALADSYTEIANECDDLRAVIETTYTKIENGRSKWPETSLN